jgi:hypothetical protein
MQRILLEPESTAIRWVAARLPLERKRQLLADLSCATVVDATPDNSAIEFELAGYERPKQSGQRSFGVEGKLLDADGATLSVDLFEDENYRLFVLELIRWDGKQIVKPNWSSLTEVDTETKWQ